jgi:hypothetical protein
MRRNEVGESVVEGNDHWVVGWQLKTGVWEFIPRLYDFVAAVDQARTKQKMLDDLRLAHPQTVCVLPASMTLCWDRAVPLTNIVNNEFKIPVVHISPPPPKAVDG